MIFSPFPYLYAKQKKIGKGREERKVQLFSSHHRHSLDFGFSKGRAFFTMCMIKLMGFSRVRNAVNK